MKCGEARCQVLCRPVTFHILPIPFQIFKLPGGFKQLVSQVLRQAPELQPD